jgi:hypothetical protein
MRRGTYAICQPRSADLRGALPLTLAAVVALFVVVGLKRGGHSAPHGYTVAEVQAAVVASSDVHEFARDTYVAVKYPRVLRVTHDEKGNYVVDLTIWTHGLSAQQGAEKEVIVTVSSGFQVVNEDQL